MLFAYTVIQTNAFSQPPIIDTPMATIQSKTILFITGAFVDSACWNEWQTYFKGRGYATIAPPWPHKDGDAATLRSRQPDTALAAVSLPDLISYYTNIIQQLPEKPILIGHSFGGLLAEILLNKGLGAACIAIHAVAPKNVLPYELKFLRSNGKALGFFTSIHKPYLISFKKWQYAFTNGMTREQQQDAYNNYAIPESKKAIRGGLSSVAKVDFRKAHLPILILAGSNDHCIPAHLCRRVYKRYKSGNKESVTEFVVRDRNHFVLGLPTWKEDAGFIFDWMQTH
jgi:pimeloyl-ACP methyl ester carboxylesterase